jgi:hypothetical protein
MAARKDNPTGPTSPWTFYDSGPDYQGHSITGTVTFDGAGALTGASVTRDAGCVWTQVVIGDPAAPRRTIDLSGLEGSRNFSKAQLNARGLVNVTDIDGYQITATA